MLIPYLSSDYLRLLEDFMVVTEENNYKLNAEVETFLADRVPNK